MHVLSAPESSLWGWEETSRETLDQHPVLSVATQTPQWEACKQGRSSTALCLPAVPSRSIRCLRQWRQNKQKRRSFCALREPRWGCRQCLPQGSPVAATFSATHPSDSQPDPHRMGYSVMSEEFCNPPKKFSLASFIQNLRSSDRKEGREKGTESICQPYPPHAKTVRHSEGPLKVIDSNPLPCASCTSFSKAAHAEV